MRFLSTLLFQEGKIDPCLAPQGFWKVGDALLPVCLHAHTSKAFVDKSFLKCDRILPEMPKVTLSI